MLSLARVGPGDVVYDLGSGDGRIPIVAAAQHGARGVGYEIDDELVALSRRTAREVGVADRVRFETGDLFEADLSPATVVTLYLSPDFNLLLRPRLLELRPGTRVVSHDFHMGEWEPDSVVHVRRGFSQTSIHLWTVPARVDGFWYLEMEGGDSFALELRQEFQRLSGVARAGGVERPLLEPRVEGERIAFGLTDTVEGTPMRIRFSGVLGEEGIRGSATGPPPFGTRPWRAVRFTSPSMAPRKR
jgi:SAM-dependent methyltransferase